MLLEKIFKCRATKNRLRNGFCHQDNLKFIRLEHRLPWYIIVHDAFFFIVADNADELTAFGIHFRWSSEKMQKTWSPHHWLAWFRQCINTTFYGKGYANCWTVAFCDRWSSAFLMIVCFGCCFILNKSIDRIATFFFMNIVK